MVVILAGSGLNPELARSLASHLVEVYCRGFLTNEEAAVLATAYSAPYPESNEQASNPSTFPYAGEEREGALSSDIFHQPNDVLYVYTSVHVGEAEEAEEGQDEFGQLEDCLPTDILSEIEDTHHNTCNSVIASTSANDNGASIGQEGQDGLDQELELERELQKHHGSAIGGDWLGLLEQMDTLLRSEQFVLRFPFSSEAMCAALLAARGDVPQACQTLSLSYTSVLSCRPCRHLLKGLGCYRKDCNFHHDLKTYVCRYWLVTHCSGEEGCVFKHDLIYPSPSLSLPQGIKGGKAAEAFPLLGNGERGGKKTCARSLGDFKRAVQ
ncbi:hypothetical protein EON64_14945, partial [archaeon]